MFAALQAIIHFARVGIVLAVVVADLALLDNVVENQLFQFTDDIG